MSRWEVERRRTRYDEFARGEWDAAFADLDPAFEMHDHGLRDVPPLRGLDSMPRGHLSFDS